MYRKLFYNICIILVIYSSILLAQKRFVDNDLSGLAFVSLGTHNINLEEFDTALASSSLPYPPLETSMYTFGAGGVIIIKDWIISAEGSGLLANSKTFGDYNSKLSGGYVTLNTGFLLAKSRSFMIYPLVGIGGGSINYKIYQEPDDMIFADVLENPSTETSLNNKSIYMNLAMSLHYNIHTFRDDRDSGNFFIGAKAGYKATIKSFDWYIQGTSTKLAEGPITGLDGYYIEFVFGIGGFNFSDVD